MIELGMHTDNWRELSGNLQTAAESAVQHGLSHIEFGTIHGQYFVNGLGYEPSVSLQSNPRALKRYLDEKGLAGLADGCRIPDDGARRFDLWRAVHSAVDSICG